MSGRVVTWSVAAALVAGLPACGSTPAASAGPTPVPAASATAGPNSGTPAGTGTPTTSRAAPVPTPPTPRTTPTTPMTPTTPTVGGTASGKPSPAPVATPTPRSTPRVSPAPSTTWRRSGPTACAVTAKYLGKDLETVPTRSKIAVLTFDGGASSTGVPSILSTLRTTRAAATFFLTGDFVRDHPTSAATIAAAHPVGNHTDTHPDLTTLSSTAVINQVRKGAAAIRAGTGRPPGPWFRFPYGARDARTIGLVNDECYVAVRWTVDSLGWKGTSGGMTAAKVRDRVLAAARPGMVVLMHVGANPDDGSTLDAAALPSVVAGLRAKGYAFVTLQQAL